MNILMVGPHPYKMKGGMSTVLKNYYNSFLNIENNLIPINTVIDGNKANKLIYFIYSYIKMIYFLTFKEVEIVHVHTASGKSFYRKSLYIYLAYIYKKKIILHVHGGGFDDFYWNECNYNKRKYISHIFNLCNLIIALGDEWKKRISKYCDSSIDIIYNSVETYDTNCYSTGSNNILFLGRLEREKGVYELLDAAKDIVAINNDIKFILAGDGDLKFIKEIANKFNISKNIILPGWLTREKVIKELKESMIFVLPSYNEGMPMSILEAMALGVPIVATDVGSIKEVVKNDINGVIINPKSSEELKEALIKLIYNPEIRKKISDNNYKEINFKFSNEINLNKLNFIYNNISKI